MRKIFTLVTILMAIFIGWIIYLADSQQSSIFFDFVAAIPYGDKLGHFMLFGTLTFLAVMASNAKSINTKVGRLPIASVAVFTVAAAEELTQVWFSNRSAGFDDLLADACGIVFFSIIAVKLVHRLKRTEEAN